MFCTTDSLSFAISPSSRARSAHSSHIFFDFAPTFTVTSASASSPHSLQVAMSPSSPFGRFVLAGRWGRRGAHRGLAPLGNEAVDRLAGHPTQVDGLSAGV